MPDTLTRYPTKGPDMSFTCSSGFPDENFDRHGERRAAAALPVGTRVLDRDSFTGTVIKITEWEGSRWYDVAIQDGSRRVGVAVRYDSDLTVSDERPAT